MSVNKHPFTEEDEDILKHLSAAGYGWAKYAQNVITQGEISEAQQQTIRNMYLKLEGQRSRNRRSYGDIDSNDISDDECMSLGEYY